MSAQKQSNDKTSEAPEDKGDGKRARQKLWNDRVEEKIDRDLEDTFPASDPPGWTSGVDRASSRTHPSGYATE